MRNTDLSSLDVNQIQRRTYDESKDATRVYLVGGGVDINPEDVKVALQEGMKQLKFPEIPIPEIVIPEQKQIEIKEIQVPVIVKEIEIKEIEKQVVVKQTEIKEIEKPPVIIKQTEFKTIDKPFLVKEPVLQRIEVPVIVKEIEIKPIEVVKNVELTISKPILYCFIIQTMVTLGLLIHNLIKK